MRSLIFLFLFASLSLSAQSPKLDFKRETISLNKSGATFAGAWSLGNMAYSGTEMLLLSNNGMKASKEMYRAQMNLGWSSINTVIFGLAYWSQNRKANQANVDWYKEQKKYQNSYMINTFLDVFYIGAGYLISRSTKGDIAQNQGFGQAIMFQGSFLLAYDAVYWFKHQRLRKKSKLPKLD